MPSLTLVPQEIVERVLAFLDPLDVASFFQTSKQRNKLVYHPGDNHLWRELYLAQPFDDPRLALTPRLERIPAESINWKSSLQAIIRARTVLNDPSKCRPQERETILRTVMLRGATPAPSFCEKMLSKNLVWLVMMLRDGALLNGTIPLSPTEAQLRACLLVHLGLTPSDARSVNKAAARAFVYDLRNYFSDGGFGPYLPDGSGRVNWVHLHAIHRVVAMHLVDLREIEPFVFPPIPMSMPYCQSIVPLGLDLKVHDWAGIEGLWHCSLCFVDHRQLLRFRDTFRVLPVYFRVIGFEEDPERPTRPRLVFAGEGRDEQTMIGRVQMTPDEHLRWKWVCGEGGQAVWSCDGVQVGGVRSSYGVLGSWTTVFHDHHDPVGPLWLRKVKTISE
ncbi:hypothetical protein EDB92DRAFT_2101458 [Lactarius akahatsu]|uniref:F-box domain-containing protein n=1 Tax=Lactarius akahatsu TaxID=416441 RepID=A0AAD4LP48_9AGAM|nr:hypothetical protein EDB92DRAFT_2101458 [Lactarius akahatsu]